MKIIGLDTSVDELGDEFATSESGKVLILDGDGPAYVAAATVKTIPTGIRRFHTACLEAQFLAETTTVEVHLTHEECYKAGRFKVNAVKPYQGQRSSSAKPPLLQALRQEVSEADPPPGVFVHMQRNVEADDAMMMKAYELGEMGIIRSEDKDLRMTPYPYYDIESGTVMPSDPFGKLWIKEMKSGKKLLGRSLKFFWAQMLMGDSADNIKGVLTLNGKDCGPVNTFDLLDPMTEIGQVCNAVVDAYRAIDQNPLPEGWLLWLLRSPDDNFWKYLNELEWTEANRTFLADCISRPWFNP